MTARKPLTKHPVRKPAATASMPKRPSEVGKAVANRWNAFSSAVVHAAPAQRIQHIRAGAKARSMVDCASTFGVSRETIFDLVGIPASTANRNIAQGGVLELPVTERLARLAAIKQHAEETFGDAEVSRQWLLASNTALGGCSPFSLLDTDIGAREVAKALASIAYGGVA